MAKAREAGAAHSARRSDGPATGGLKPRCNRALRAAHGVSICQRTARRDGAERSCANATSGHLTQLPILAHRVPELRRNELVLLASIGALNSIGCKDEKDALASLEPVRAGKKQRLHRRDALWQVERAARSAGPLLDGIPESELLPRWRP